MLAARSFAIVLCLVALGACAPKPYPPVEKSLAVAGQADQPAAEAETMAAAPEPAPTPEPAPAAVPQPAPAAATALAVPPVASEPAPAAAPAPSEPVSTYPYGTAQPEPAPVAVTPPASPGPASPGTSVAAAEAMEPAAAEPETYTIISPDTGEPVVQPYSAGWVNPKKSAEQVQADIEGCYNYAWSQVEHDMRIEDDVAAARGDSDQGLGFADLTRRMNLYEHKNRRTELINDCMEAKGYTRG